MVRETPAPVQCCQPETDEEWRARVLRECGDGCTGGPDCPNV